MRVGLTWNVSGCFFTHSDLYDFLIENPDYFTKEKIYLYGTMDCISMNVSILLYHSLIIYCCSSLQFENILKFFLRNLCTLTLLVFQTSRINTYIYIYIAMQAIFIRLVHLNQFNHKIVFWILNATYFRLPF